MRFAAVVAVAVSALAAASGVRACINVHVSPWPTSAGPGEPVQFTISTLTPGAQYTVSVDGRAVVSGTATGDSVKGTFQMPDLGSTSFSATIAASVSDDDLEQSPWNVTAPLGFEAPAPPPRHVSVPPPADPAPPAPAVPKTARAHPAQRTHAKRPAPVVTPAARTQPVPPIPAVPRRHRVTAPAAPAPAAAVRPPRTHAPPPHVHVRVQVRAPAVAHRTFAPLAFEQRLLQLEPVEAKSLTRSVAAPERRHGRRSLQPLLLLLLLAGAVPAAAVYLRCRRRPVPELSGSEPLSPAEIEAELQEIIAEERARALGARRTPRSD